MLVSVLLGLLVSAATPHISAWKPIAPGMELRSLNAQVPSLVGDSKIIILRIDPSEWQLDLVGASSTGDRPGHTAREWAGAYDLSVAINAGMFAQDHVTHLGYMEYRGHVSSPEVDDYQSVAAFDPRNPEDRPPFRVFDLDVPGITIETIRQDYASLVQNLRLGTNRWSQQNKQWSEAALGEDTGGRVLLVFSRSPFSMHDLNAELLSADIGLVALQHLEGGPEAQLYLKAGDVELEVFGSYETGFREDDGNATAWPIPNVLGVRRRSVTN